MKTTAGFGFVLVLAIALALALAGCAGPAAPTTPPMTGSGATPSLASTPPSPTAIPVPTAWPSPISPQPASPSLTGRATPTASSTGCTLASPTAFTLPARLAGHEGHVAGLSDNGDLLVIQTWNSSDPEGIVRQDLTIWNRETGATEGIVSRRAPGGEVATTQIGSATANADWVIWVENVGFDIGGDWSVWAFDRHARSMRKVATLDPGPHGIAPTGWISEVSLLGDVAAWSAPFKTASTRIESKVYVADLGKDTVRRLSANANYPSVLSPDQVVAAVAVGRDGNGYLAQPGAIDIQKDTVQIQTWVEPARVLGLVAGPAGMIEMRLLREATAELPERLADVVVRDRDGSTRTFVMPSGSGPVVAADRVLLWQDALHLWALPSGQAQPLLLAETPDDNTAYRVMTNGGTVFWSTSSSTVDGESESLQLLGTNCP